MLSVQNLQREEMQTNGMIFLLDGQKTTNDNFNLKYDKIFVTMFAGKMPVRLGKCYMCHSNLVLRLIYKTFKFILPAFLRKRVEMMGEPSQQVLETVGMYRSTASTDAAGAANMPRSLGGPVKANYARKLIEYVRSESDELKIKVKCKPDEELGITVEPIGKLACIVTQVVDGSPAADSLNVNDVILKANGETATLDAMTALASDDGRFRFVVLRTVRDVFGRPLSSVDVEID
jgi:hypothetical protein